VSARNKFRGGVPAYRNDYPSPKNSSLRLSFSTLPQGEGRTSLAPHRERAGNNASGARRRLARAGVVFFTMSKSLPAGRDQFAVDIITEMVLSQPENSEADFVIESLVLTRKLRNLCNVWRVR